MDVSEYIFVIVVVCVQVKDMFKVKICPDV